MTDLESDLLGRVAMALDLAACPDGAHHLHHVVDQMVRALTGCEQEDIDALDYHGAHYTYQTLDESEEYKEWVKLFEGECSCDHPEDCECELDEWPTGIPS